MTTATATAHVSAHDFEVMATRFRYEVLAQGSSKFWGEPDYVAYYWDMFLNGNYDDDFGRTIGFVVTREDRAIFPELRGLDSVYLFEDDMGFVHRTTGPGDDDFEGSMDF